jgi:hypothetical protein
MELRIICNKMMLWKWEYHREMGRFSICINAYDSHLLTLYFVDFMVGIIWN